MLKNLILSESNLLKFKNPVFMINLNATHYVNRIPCTAITRVGYDYQYYVVLIIIVVKNKVLWFILQIKK